MNFKDAYTFPLKGPIADMAFTANGAMVFNFVTNMSDENQKIIIDVINGGTPLKTDLQLSLIEDMIYANVSGVFKEFILLRGWGFLTGVGGLNLPEDQAAELQHQFGMYIIEKLTPHETLPSTPQ